MNDHRQDFTPEMAGRPWREAFHMLDTRYYPTLEIKFQGTKPPVW